MVLGWLVRGFHEKTMLWDDLAMAAGLGIGNVRVTIDLAKDGHCVIKLEDGDRGRSYDVFRDNLIDTLERQARDDPATTLRNLDIRRHDSEIHRVPNRL